MIMQVEYLFLFFYEKRLHFDHFYTHVTPALTVNIGDLSNRLFGMWVLLYGFKSTLVLLNALYLFLLFNVDVYFCKYIVTLLLNKSAKYTLKHDLLFSFFVWVFLFVFLPCISLPLKLICGVLIFHGSDVYT